MCACVGEYMWIYVNCDNMYGEKLEKKIKPID